MGTFWAMEQCIFFSGFLGIHQGTGPIIDQPLEVQESKTIQNLQKTLRKQPLHGLTLLTNQPNQTQPINPPTQPNQTQPNPTKPDPTKPNQTNPPRQASPAAQVQVQVLCGEDAAQAAARAATQKKLGRGRSIEAEELLLENGLLEVFFYIRAVWFL